MKRKVYVGDVVIGGEEIILQGMAKSDTNDVDKVLEEIEDMVEEGASLVRVAVPDRKSIDALREIVKRSPVPIIADIHFNPELAILSMDAGVKKIRLNPSNIRNKRDIERIVKKAKEMKIPIRVGVNSGSIVYEGKKGKVNSDDLIESLKREVSILEKLSFKDIVLSAKSPDVMLTIETYRKMKGLFPYPIHLGVTATGGGEEGLIKSSIAIGYLLMEGIGDTIRVSLTDSSSDEVRVGRLILENLGLRKRERVEIIACPKCGRCNKDFDKILERVREEIGNLKIPIKVAVMGCEVNALGEAEQADYGIALTRGKILLFKKGVKIKFVDEENAVDELKKLIESEVKDASI